MYSRKEESEIMQDVSTICEQARVRFKMLAPDIPLGQGRDQDTKRTGENALFRRVFREPTPDPRRLIGKNGLRGGSFPGRYPAA